MIKTFRYFIILICLFLFQYSFCQPLNQKKGFTRQDTLRGSVGPGRDWWNVTGYDIEVKPDYDTKFINGVNIITFKWLKASTTDGTMQIDLQEPLLIDSVIYQNKSLKFERDGNAWFIKWPKGSHAKEEKIKICYHGNPRVAVTPPWDGGWIWTKDDKGRPWMTVACQGLGASVWYPCKDHQSDEPDNGATITITVPDSLVAVSNGRLISKSDYPSVTYAIDSVNKRLVVSKSERLNDYTWKVKNPINNYNIVPYIGKYVNFTDTLNGEKGKLDLSYWILDYNLDKAKKQFDRDVKPMLRCFEYWFGPYPFYEDSYKLVESSHLGMEHQSATAYGNHFMDGYLGRDLSGSGWGKKWDYIIIHESGHEWFANNITTNDIADMWVHEGITDYSETLFVEWMYGKDAADAYTQGLRRTIRNDKPIIGPYGVNQEGSGDMYNKGNNLMHTIRQVINDDTVFRNILRGLNKEFYHKTVDSKDVEAYITKQSGKDFSKVFDQYLRTTKIPVLEYKIDSSRNFSYRWANCIEGFNMPVRTADKKFWIYPTTSWQQMPLPLNQDGQFDKNFYITVKKVQ